MDNQIDTVYYYEYIHKIILFENFANIIHRFDIVWLC